MLTDVIERPGFGAQQFTVKRTARASYVNGVAVPGAVTQVTIVASVQPVTGRNLMVLPEAQRGEENRLLFTRTERLRTREPANGSLPAVAPDRVVIDGEDWIVHRVEQWSAFGGTHWRCWVARRVVGDSARSEAT